MFMSLVCCPTYGTALPAHLESDCLCIACTKHMCIILPRLPPTFIEKLFPCRAILRINSPKPTKSGGSKAECAYLEWDPEEPTHANFRWADIDEAVASTRRRFAASDTVRSSRLRWCHKFGPQNQCDCTVPPTEIQSVPDLKHVLAHVVSMTTDMGVEIGIGDVSGLSVEEILPTWSQDELQAAANDTADPASCLADTFMPKALVIPGVNHIVNNMSKDASESMLQWQQWLAGFKPIVQLLHHSHIRNRLVASCFRGSPHAWMEKYFQSFAQSLATDGLLRQV
ncbi:unnamed protein product [Symbiodinium sp. KB8]|nr:unnamed protein product [Symbiodinium sp. KB8]